MLPDDISRTVKEEVRRSVAEHRERAQAGDADSMYVLGIMYFAGILVPADMDTAIDWLTKSAEGGNPDAQMFMSVTLQLAQATNPEEIKKAHRWMLESAQGGNPLAQLQVGIEYGSGERGPVNYVEAFRWFELASNQGLAEGQCYLAIMHQYGATGTINGQEAVRLMTLSAEQGFDDAQFRLGEMYEGGKFVAKSPSKARLWYQRSARQGNAYAMAAYARVEP